MAGESPDIAERERDQQESGGRTSGPPETVPAETPAPTKRNISGPTPAGEEPAEPAEPADDPEEPAERAGDPDGDGGKTAGSDATMVFSPAAALRRSAAEATASGEGRRDGAAGADPAGPEGGASGTTADADDAPDTAPKKRRATTTAGEATDAGPDATASGAETADAAPGGPRSGAKAAAAAPAVTAAASGADAPADAAARAGAAVDSGADAGDGGASGPSTARGGKTAGSDATMVFSPAAALADDAASASSGGAERGEGTPSGGPDPVPAATPRRDAAAGADATLDFSPSPAPSGAVPADPRRDADARGAGAAAEKPGASAPEPPKPGRAPDAAASSETGEEAAPSKPTAVPPKPGKAPSGPTPAGDAKDADAPSPSTGPSAEGAKPTAKGADLSKPTDAAPPSSVASSEDGERAGGAAVPPKPAGTPAASGKSTAKGADLSKPSDATPAGAAAEGGKPADSAAVPPKPAEAPAASGKSAAKGTDLSKPSDAAPAEGGKPARSASEPPAAPAAPVPPPPAGPPPVPDSEREPLELLAALTNTPPPPPTPLRTVLRRIKIWSPLVVLLLIIFTVAQSLRPLPEPTLGLTAADTYTFDGEAPTAPWPGSGQAALDVDGIGTFGTSGDQEPVPIASVAKVMTAYLILRDHPMDADPESTGATIPVDQQAEDDVALGDTDDESVVSVTAGDELTQREAIEAIMIASANNVARLLARWDAGSEADFVAKMNETAAELGMKNTTYTDPSGLSPDTVSTAEDQVILGKAAMEDPVFRQIVRMPEYYDSNGERHGNWNHLVPMNGTVGIKTGTTTTALGNLLFAAEQTVGEETRLIVGAVLRQPPDPVDLSILTGALNAGRTLIEFAQQELIEETVLAAGDVVGYVDDGLGGRTPVTVTEDVQAAGWPGLELRVELKAAEDLPHSAAAGTEVGTLTVGDGTGGRETTVPVALAEELTEPGFGAKLRRLG
ncbi:D-alanyl-D-alanine carboxypeptidase [Streptomyces carpaticus]|uniref:D-alanyl-D-alanine carboxypeptidase n=1 Tax=Streptomyces carpaticus TaxID=285558 RepID=UPI0021FA63BB|nr:D-alanyl-D-alanine carboxypeptidase [Streptomyces carpaticus]